MKPPKSNSKRELPEEGTHNAVCIQAVDLGSQPGSVKFPDPKRKIQLAFQLVDEQTSEGKAMVVYRQYTFSGSSKSTLMKDIKAWFGLKNTDEFDMDDVLNKPVLVTIARTETANGEFANVTNLSAVPKGTKVRKATEPVFSFYLDPEHFDKDAFDNLPEWMRNKIATSPEYAECAEMAEESKVKNGKKKTTAAKKAAATAKKQPAKKRR